jgi:hypothetical protein
MWISHLFLTILEKRESFELYIGSNLLEQFKKRASQLHKSVKNGQLKKRASYGRIKVLP